MSSIVLNDERTWPPELVRYLEAHHHLFLTWERRGETGQSNLNPQQAVQLARAYDAAVEGLRNTLRPYMLHGYHCTRLTEPEIEHILSHGMQLPTPYMLAARIESLRDAGLIEARIAETLKQENEAGEANRAAMIWFCFFEPHIAGQFGIEGFLRFWGGEALYNSHERDPVTGPILMRIGVPCLIEADVPIASFPPHTYLPIHTHRQFLVNRGFETKESCDHEGCATLPIPSGNIRRVIRFPENDFILLTGCEDWTPPITLTPS